MAENMTKMKKKLTIEFNWNSGSLDSIPEEHQGLLEEDAKCRIFEQIDEGYREGELASTLETEDGEENNYSGWWSIKTEDESETA